MIFLPSRLVQIGCDCDAIQLLALGADPPGEKGVYLVNTIRGSSKSFPWSFFFLFTNIDFFMLLSLNSLHMILVAVLFF